MRLQKKDFWKGFGAACVLMAVLYGGKHVMIQMHQLPPFSGEYAKLQLLETYLEDYYVDSYDADVTKEMMYAGLVAGIGDPYTYYLPEDSLKQQMETNSGHFVGIGVGIYATDDGYITISDVTKGSPAEAAGIQIDDKIIEVDGESIKGMSGADVSAKVKGEVGTDVTLGIYRKSVNDMKTITVTRADIQVHTVAYEMLENDMGYISISNFRENTYQQFEKALDTLQTEGMTGLILDLRENTGGLVLAAHEIGDELLPEGTMVYTMDKEGHRQDTTCDAEYTDIPLVVLVNEHSASASEILAGAIQDTGRGELIGTTTFGKGLVQRLFALPDGSGLNVTIQKYYTPKGTSIHGVGIEPDVYVEQAKEYQSQKDIPKQQDVQLQKAFEILKQKMV